jgi:hypothetical protein
MWASVARLRWDNFPVRTWMNLSQNILAICKITHTIWLKETNYTFYQCSTSANGKTVVMPNTTSLKLCADYCALIGFALVGYAINAPSVCQCIQSTNSTATDGFMTCTQPCPNGDTSITCGGTTVYSGLGIVGSNSCKCLGRILSTLTI